LRLRLRGSVECPFYKANHIIRPKQINRTSAPRQGFLTGEVANYVITFTREFRAKLSDSPQTPQTQGHAAQNARHATTPLDSSGVQTTLSIVEETGGSKEK